MLGFPRIPSKTVEGLWLEEAHRTSSEPERVSQPNTNLICEFIVNYLCNKYGSITAVYLYGSRAYGNYKPNSDHDFYFVYQTGYECGLDFKHPDFLKHISELRNDAKSHFGCKIDVDVMCCSQETFDELKSDTDCHAGIAKQHGHLLYCIR